MPYSTKLTFYPGEALIKFQIFHWDGPRGESNARANLHTSSSSLQDLHTPSQPYTIGFRYAWLPMKLKQTATFAFFYVQSRN